MTRLLVADHQEVMRAGLRAFLARSSVEVAAECGSEKDLQRELKKSTPDVVLLDVRFAGGDGFKTLATIKKRWPQLPVLMWTTDDNPTYTARALALGANGFLSRGASRSELLATLRTAASRGDAWTEEHLAKFTGSAPLPDQLEVHITRREAEVLRQLAYGLPNKEIALVLGISYETVKEHIQHILRKLGAKDRTQAAVWAIRQGIE